MIAPAYKIVPRAGWSDGSVEVKQSTLNHQSFMLAELTPDLEILDRMIEIPRAVNGTLSLDDGRVLPILRSLGVVKGLRLPQRGRDYFDTKMARISFEPLPSA